LKAFERYGLALAGWPISDEMIVDGLRVQYFERVRMEHHPELASAGVTVQFTRLGAEMVPQGQLARIGAFASTRIRVYFPQTGHSLAAPFLKYWRDQGGLELFGYPISEPVWEGGLRVQWFERARMEHHPELANRGWGVQLTRLGEQSLARSGGAPTQAAPAQSGVEVSLLDMINAERVKVGVGQVESLPEVAEVARSRSADMAARNYFSHTTPEGIDVFAMLRARNIGFGYAGEILSRSLGHEDSRLAQVTLESFLNSPSHREILVNGRYTHAGAGHARAADGASYFTVVFLQR
jgi:uncharacterized protein YkwD